MFLIVNFLLYCNIVNPIKILLKYDYFLPSNRQYSEVMDRASNLWDRQALVRVLLCKFIARPWWENAKMWGTFDTINFMKKVYSRSCKYQSALLLWNIKSAPLRVILIFDIGSQLAANFQTPNKSVRTALDTRFYAYKNSF